jgi:hypothetical protein
MTCGQEGLNGTPDDLAALAQSIEEERRLLDEQEADALVTLLRLAGQVARHQAKKGATVGPAMTASYRRALLRVGRSGLGAVVEGDAGLRLRLPPEVGKLEWLCRLDGVALRQLLGQMGLKQARRDEIIRAVKQALGQALRKEQTAGAATPEGVIGAAFRRLAATVARALSRHADEDGHARVQAALSKGIDQLQGMLGGGEALAEG